VCANVWEERAASVINLKMEAVSFSENLTSTYKNTGCYKTKEGILASLQEQEQFI
jgi:hypothetical protein